MGCGTCAVSHLGKRHFSLLDLTHRYVAGTLNPSEEQLQ
jgi:hypothetical protein